LEGDTRSFEVLDLGGMKLVEKCPMPGAGCPMLGRSEGSQD